MRTRTFRRCLLLRHRLGLPQLPPPSSVSSREREQRRRSRRRQQQRWGIRTQPPPQQISRWAVPLLLLLMIQGGAQAAANSGRIGCCWAHDADAASAAAALAREMLVVRASRVYCSCSPQPRASGSFGTFPTRTSPTSEPWSKPREVLLEAALARTVLLLRGGSGAAEAASAASVGGSFPPKDVPLFTADDFWLTRRLGTGKFSDVFEALQDINDNNNSHSKHRDHPAADVQQQRQRLVVIKVLKPVSDRKVRREVAVLRRAKEGGAVTVVRLLGIVLQHQSDESEDEEEKESAARIHPVSGPHPMPSLVLEHAGPHSQWLCHPTAAATASSSAGPLSDYETRYYVCHLLAALRDLHQLGIMHRDVKPRNVLINRNLNHNVFYNNDDDISHSQQLLSISKPLVLIDLGLADFYSPHTAYNVRVASRHYKSPELLLGFAYYTPALDLWGVGCVLAGLLLRREPFFRGKDNPDQLAKIVSVLGTRDLQRYVDKYGIPHPAATTLPPVGSAGEEDDSSNVWQNLPEERVADWNAMRGPDCPIAPAQGLDLLDRLLVYDHQARCTAQQAMDHPFFDPVRDRVDAEIRALRSADNEDTGATHGRPHSAPSRPVPESALSFLSSTADR